MTVEADRDCFTVKCDDAFRPAVSPHRRVFSEGKSWVTVKSDKGFLREKRASPKGGPFFITSVGIPTLLTVCDRVAPYNVISAGIPTVVLVFLHF